VLRSPNARADYDAELGAARRPAAATTPAASRAGAAGGAPSFADRLVDPRAEDGPVGARRGRKWAPVIVVGVVFVTVLVFTAYAVHGHPSGSPVQVQTTQQPRYTVGSCVALTSGPLATPVPCDGPSSGRIAATTDTPRPCPPGTDAVPLEDQLTTLCLTPP
jgi:hypothetical protein